MRPHTVPLPSLVLVASLLGCSRGGEEWDAWIDQSPHTNTFIRVGDLRLNYLDWGGQGIGLVLLPGEGESPHVFDDVAPSFTDQFRVLALARRGHGRSDGLNASYELDSLIQDLRAWLDSLAITRVVLVGHSMAGNELTRFAVLYPDRLAKLIYLDAGYDYSTDEYQHVAETWPDYVDWTVRDSDLQSLGAFRQYRQRASYPHIPWTNAAKTAMLDVLIARSDGTFSNWYQDTSIVNRWWRAEEYPREYDRVQAAALGIFAQWYVDELVPPDSSAEARRRVAAWLRTVGWPYQEGSMASFQSELPDAQVLLLPETIHTLFLHRPDTVVATMKSFLRDVH